LSTAPDNLLEEVLQQAQQGVISKEAFMQQLFVSDLVLPSVAPVEPGTSNVTLLTWERKGTIMAGVFTSLERMEPYREQIREHVLILGAELFRNPPPGVGLVINPGWPVGMMFSEYGLKEVRNELATRSAHTVGEPVGTLEEVDAAIRAGLVGRISLHQMIRTLLAGPALVPLWTPPTLAGGSIVSWRPATVTDQRDGSRYVVAFTDEALDKEYYERCPDYPYRFKVQVGWLLGLLPPEHGLLFNFGGTENGFPWTASDILIYKKEHGL
jgi:hypothetical protein